MATLAWHPMAMPRPRTKVLSRPALMLQRLVWKRRSTKEYKGQNTLPQFQVLKILLGELQPPLDVGCRVRLRHCLELFCCDSFGAAVALGSTSGFFRDLLLMCPLHLFLQGQSVWHLAERGANGAARRKGRRVNDGKLHLLGISLHLHFTLQDQRFGQDAKNSSSMLKCNFISQLKPHEKNKNGLLWEVPEAWTAHWKTKSTKSYKIRSSSLRAFFAPRVSIWSWNKERCRNQKHERKEYRMEFEVRKEAVQRHSLKSTCPWQNMPPFLVSRRFKRCLQCFGVGS